MKFRVAHETSRNNMYAVMAHAGIWTDLHYQTIVGDTVVNAIVPAKLLKKNHGLLPKKAVTLLKNPSAEHQLALRAMYKIKVNYTYLGTEDNQKAMA